MNASYASDVLNEMLGRAGDWHRPTQALKEFQQDQESELATDPLAALRASISSSVVGVKAMARSLAVKTLLRRG